MIWWDILLETDNVKKALEDLYSEMSLAGMAEYLGVSVSAIRAELVHCKIPLRKRGGRQKHYPKGG